MRNFFKKDTQQQSQFEAQKSILNERLDRTVENQNNKRRKYIQKIMALQQKQENCLGGRHPEHSQFFQQKIQDLQEKIKQVDSKEKSVVDFQITFDGLLSQLQKLEGLNLFNLDEKTRNDNFTILCSLKRQAFNLQKQFEQKQFLQLLNGLIDSINQYQERYKQAGVNVKGDIDREEIQQILSQVEQHRNMRKQEKEDRKRERKKRDRKHSEEEDKFIKGQFEKQQKKHKEIQIIQQQEPIKQKELVESVIIQNDFQQQQQNFEIQQIQEKPNRNKRQERQDCQNDRNDRQHRKNRQDKQDKYDQQYVEQKYDYQKKFIEKQQKQKDEQIIKQDIFQDQFQQKQQQFQQKIVQEEKHSELQAVIDQLNQKLQIKEEQNRKLYEQQQQKQKKEEELKQLAEENLCLICFNKKKEYVAVPCGHFAYCGECKSMVKKECLICRSPCQQLLKIFS